MKQKFELFGLGTQLLIAIFPATTIVAIILGLDPCLALFAAGLATLWAIFVTKGKVPMFLGSSFAYIGGAALILEQTNDPAYIGGATIVVGALYVIYALLAYVIGLERIKKVFSPVVSGTIVLLIGLTLTPSAVNDIGTGGINWAIAAIVILIIGMISLKAKGFIKIIPILFGLVGGYIIALCLGQVDFSTLSNAHWFSIPDFVAPKFDLNSILIMLPITLSTISEHLGDVQSLSAVAGKDFLTDPGIHRTILADGVGTALSGLCGFPPNTTYSEGVATMGLTKRTETPIVFIAALWCIILSFCGKLSGLLLTIPKPVIGMTSLFLYGMIATLGLTTLVSNKVDFSKTRNVIISGLMLGVAVGGFTMTIGSVTLTPIAIAAILGILLQIMLPEE